MIKGLKNFLLYVIRNQGGFLDSSYSMSTNTDASHNEKYTVSDGSSGATYGPKLQIGDAGTVNLATSDYGALAYASHLSDDAVGLARQAGDTAQFTISKASELLATKAESDITKFTKPLIAVAAIALAGIALLVWGGKKVFS